MQPWTQLVVLLQQFADWHASQLTFSDSSQSKMPQQGSFSTRDDVTASLSRSSVTIGFACRSKLHSRWQCWCTLHCMALHHLTWCYHLHVSPTCHTDPGSGPFSEQLYVLTVSQRSEVVPLQWDQRCNIVCQVTLHQPHCWCQCSRTGWRHFK